MEDMDPTSGVPDTSVSGVVARERGARPRAAIGIFRTPGSLLTRPEAEEAA